MSATPVERLNAALEGRYRIERELGQGGMATVYLARDEKHNRSVALKVLKPELAAVVGAERFLAEIETTANLQHPHILPLFDSGEADTYLFYVMPYVEGETLGDRLPREHQLPVDEAVQIAKNVAEALDYAHKHGVIHRDIKPANILLQSGKPVLSDFGIALAVGVAVGGRLTETGLSLGTPHYMSPERATGDLSVGAATDVYALGCVLYEMLVGEPPHTGSTAQAILGKIVMGDADPVTKHRRSVPANVDAAIRKSLERVPADRFMAAQDFAKALGDPGFRHGVLAVAGAGAAGRGQLPALLVGAAFTADGSALVYQGGVAGATQLWLRRWSDVDATPIRGTEGAQQFALSPDEREVAFAVAGVGLRVAPLDGGPSRTLVDAVFRVWDWSSDGFVYFSPPSLPSAVLARVPAGGGAVESLTELGEGELGHVFLTVLPGERMGVFQIVKDLTGEASEIWVLDLETRERRFLTAGNAPVYASTGHLLFGTPDGVLMRQPIDASTAELTGAAVPVAEGLVMDLGLAGYAVSESGTLIYAVGASVFGEGSFEPVWVTRSGDASPIDPSWRVNSPSFFQTGSGWRLSPDGERLAFMQTVDGNDDVWIKQLPDGPLERLTSDDLVDTSPFWSPDGEFVAYTRLDPSGVGGSAATGWAILQRRADGTGSPQPVLEGDGLYQGRWSPDGDWIVFRTVSAPTASPGDDILGFRPGVDSVPVPLVADPEYSEQGPALSRTGAGSLIRRTGPVGWRYTSGPSRTWTQACSPSRGPEDIAPCGRAAAASCSSSMPREGSSRLK